VSVQQECVDHVTTCADFLTLRLLVKIVKQGGCVACVSGWCMRGLCECADGKAEERTTLWIHTKAWKLRGLFAHVLLIRMNRQFQVFCSVLSWNPEWDGHKVGGNEGWGGMGWLAVTRSDCCSATSVMPSAVPLNRFQRTRVHQ
jgi:hypothetical protein